MQYCKQQSKSLLVRRFGESKDKFVAKNKVQCNAASNLALPSTTILTIKNCQQQSSIETELSSFNPPQWQCSALQSSLFSFLVFPIQQTYRRGIYFEEEVLYLKCIEKEFNAGQVQLASTGMLFAELMSLLVNRDGSSSNVVKRFCSSTQSYAPFLPRHYDTELDADVSSRITELIR